MLQIYLQTASQVPHYFMGTLGESSPPSLLRTVATRESCIFMALTFNVPPNWPAMPEGWKPDPSWRPDPAWGPAPKGWEFWTDNSPRTQQAGGHSDPAAAAQARAAAPDPATRPAAQASPVASSPTGAEAGQADSPARLTAAQASSQQAEQPRQGGKKARQGSRGGRHRKPRSPRVPVLLAALLLLNLFLTASLLGGLVFS